MAYWHKDHICTQWGHRWMYKYHYKDMDWASMDLCMFDSYYHAMGLYIRINIASMDVNSNIAHHVSKGNLYKGLSNSHMFLLHIHLYIHIHMYHYRLSL